MTESEPGDVDPRIDELAGEPLDPTDVGLLEELAEVYALADPVPAGLVERVQFALALDEVYDEVAQLTRVPLDALATRAEELTGTRTETLTFTAERLTAMVTVTRVEGALRIDGWLTPPGRTLVRLRRQDAAGHREVQADDTGRFVLDGVPKGFAQLSFHRLDGDDAEAAVVTPLFQL